MILFVSPHLDDAVFSAGALIADLTPEHEVVIATVFTQSVPNPTGFALRCQTDKDIAADVDYMALRRAEDAQATANLGARAMWLDLPEAPHRGYDSASALFGPRLPQDDLGPVTAAIAPLVAQASLVFGPYGHGKHVDHLLVRDALQACGWALYWLDQPYALRAPFKADAALTQRHYAPKPTAVSAKLAACAAYASQLDFQFGGVDTMRRAMSAVAEQVMHPTNRAEAAALDAIFTAKTEISR